MTVVYRAECDGCGARMDTPDSWFPPNNWHCFDLKDTFGSVYRIDVCPACWPVKKLSDLISAETLKAVERKRPSE